MLSSLPADPNLILLDIAIRNVVAVAFMMSTERVTFLYCCMMETDIEVFSTLTFGDICQAVFPITQPTRSGPQIDSAFLISFMVTGKFDIMFMLR